MVKKKCISLDVYFNRFIKNQVKSGKFSLKSEAAREAHSMINQIETKKSDLINELIKGEKSGFVKDFNRDDFLSNLENKYTESEAQTK